MFFGSETDSIYCNMSIPELFSKVYFTVLILWSTRNLIFWISIDCIVQIYKPTKEIKVYFIQKEKTWLMMNKSMNGKPVGKRYPNMYNLVIVLILKLGKCKCLCAIISVKSIWKPRFDISILSMGHFLWVSCPHKFLWVYNSVLPSVLVRNSQYLLKKTPKGQEEISSKQVFSANTIY